VHWVSWYCWGIIACRISQITEQEIDLCLLILEYTLINKISLCIHLYLYYIKCEFILRSPAPIQYCAGHSSFFALLVCKLPLLTLPIHHAFTFIYSDFRIDMRISELKNCIIAVVQCFCKVPFPFSLSFYSFPKFLRLRLFPSLQRGYFTHSNIVNSALQCAFYPVHHLFMPGF
jgi:hypothetical protein